MSKKMTPLYMHYSLLMEAGGEERRKNGIEKGRN